ncbi:MAG: DUF885 domain-containing protein [Acidobacteria bacterium]|nr:DUF885 domain-containing protein [Acidobacteriota bacterium]
MLALQAHEKQGSDRWQDLSKEGLAAWQKHDEQILKDLHSIPRNELTVEQQSAYDLFERDAQDQVEGFRQRIYIASFLGAAIRFWPSVPQALRFAQQQRFDSIGDYQAWLRRLDSLPVFLDQQQGLMQEAIQEHWTETKAQVQQTIDFVESQRRAAVENSLLYQPFQHFPDNIAAVEQSRLSESAKQSIANRIVPALGRFEAFLKNEYLPSGQDSPGFFYWPKGAQLYAFLAHESTGTQLDVQQMRELGSRELERIRQEMEALLPKLGYGKTLAEAFDSIRTDPALHCKTPDELLMMYRAMAKRIDPTVVKLFNVLPRMPYGVEGIRAGRGLGSTYHPPTSVSGPGMVVVDIANPEIRPKNEVVALMLHEGVPGHHLQYAFDMERCLRNSSDEIDRCAEAILHERLLFPARDIGSTEGWALYAESLGDELGLYVDPVDKFGQLDLQLTRAARVMIDTGIHSLGWGRAKAIQYFVDVTGKPISVATDEVTTAIGNPGVQLSYTIGQLQFQHLRALANQELGSKFDVRDFHNLVLQAGPLPFDILERNLNQWIRTRKKVIHSG